MSVRRTATHHALAVLALALAGAFAGCHAPAPAPAPRALPTQAGADHAGALVVAHGGVGSGPELADGPRAAAARGLDTLLADGRAPLDGAIAAVTLLEDDPRFNAGTGANIRLDGHTIQMDASVMTGDGRFAAVAAIERVTNPVRVARAVLDTPHLLLAGDGATRFAHRLGFPDVVPTCPQAEAKYRTRLARVAALLGRSDTTVYDWRAVWNFPGPLPPELAELGRHGDTVGAVARGADGTFAAALSTGGTSVTLYGRVGDVPIHGAGLYAGPAGAVACTGDGEEIVKRFLALRTYERIAAGTPAREAVRLAAAGFPSSGTVGLIAVDAHGWGVAANRSMAWGLATR
jgi:L-asparaginase / beta-aspartyl-peptidase